MAKLVLVSPAAKAGERRELVLPAHPVVIGRDPSCALSLMHAHVSRYHARVSLTSEGWCLEDLASENGCLVNDRPVTRAILRDADMLTLGRTVLRFDLGSRGMYGVPDKAWVN